MYNCKLLVNVKTIKTKQTNWLCSLVYMYVHNLHWITYIGIWVNSLFSLIITLNNELQSETMNYNSETSSL